MATSLKLACVNIERDNHLERVKNFIGAYGPDVLCLQEVCEPDLPLFEKLLGQKLAYAPMTRHGTTGTIVGVALGARTPLQNVAVHYYKGNPAEVPTYKRTGAGAFEVPDTSTLNHALLCATVDGLRISTTHLTWTIHGQSTPEQLHDVDELLKFAAAEAAQHGGLLMCGDFNAPRGNATFGKIAERFTDAIPPHYQGSLDMNLHRVGRENPAEGERMKSLMVDGLFHTPNYKTANVELNAGVSDHMAVTATLSKA